MSMSAFFVYAAERSLRQMQAFVPQTLLTLWISLMMTYLLVSKGLLKYLALWSKSLTARVGLPDSVIAASLIAFGSVLGANAMLSQLYHENKITERDAYLGAILNGTSLNVRQIFTYQLPVIIPLLGWKAGSIYLLCFIVTALIRYCYVLFCARSCDLHREISFPVPVKVDSLFSWKKQLYLFAKIACTYLLITFAVIFLFNTGLGEALERMVAPISQILQLPLVLIAPIVIFIFNPIAGSSAVGTLQSHGTVSDLDAILAIIVGSLLLLPFYGFRSGTIARTTSLFGTRLGMKISMTSTLLAVISRLIFLISIMGYKIIASQSY